MVDKIRTAKTDGRGRARLGPEYADQNVYLQLLSEGTGDLPVYFIRHGREDGTHFGASQQGIRTLFEKHKIGLDWGTGGRVARDLFRENGGESAVTDIETLQEIGRSGGRVFAIYPSLWDGEAEYGLIGDVYPGTPLETFAVDDGSSEKDDDGMLRLNTLQLTNVIEISENEAPTLFDPNGGRPTRGTVRKVRKISDVVHDVYNDYWD